MKKISYFHINLEDLIVILNALSNRIRLKVFLALLEDELCVCELQQIFNIPQSNLSHQLSILRYSGLVKNRHQGKLVFYFVPEEVKNNEIIEAIKRNAQLQIDEIEKIKRLKMSKKGGK